MNDLRTIAVFCGSSTGNKPAYAERAKAFAASMAARTIGLVYGGGNRGLMGIVAETAYAAGVPVTGVLLRPCTVRTCTQKVEDSLIVVPTMHERKAKMYELADGFAALPGGVGTYEELLEVYTWLQLGYHHKPIGILNTEGFYDPLLSFLQKSCAEGFMHKDHLDALIVERDPERLLDRMERETPVLSDKLTGRPAQKPVAKTAR